MSELVTTNQTLSTKPPVRTAETIAAEIRALTASMLSNVLEIGRRMCEVKEMLPHGSFGAWIRENTGYSPSTANNFMRLFQEYGATQGSLFGTEINCQTFGNLSYSKALALLSVPAEDREEFVRDHDVEAMSTRELQQAIQERDRARAEAEREAQKARDKADRELQSAQAQLEQANKALAKARKEREAVQKRAVELEQKLAAAGKREAVRGDPDLVEFQVHFNAAKEDVEKMKTVLDRVAAGGGGELAKKLRSAMAALGRLVAQAAE